MNSYFETCDLSLNEIVIYNRNCSQSRKMLSGDVVK